MGGNEPILIEVPWNVVDWLNQTAGFSATVQAIVILCGAILCMVIPYLLGSINPAILISKVFYHQDIRNFGSGNAGTTNMLRTYGKKAGAATFLLDLAKAAVAVLIGRLLWAYNGGALAGFFAVFGHIFPVYYHFKGGKGVACMLMVTLVTSPTAFLFLIFAFLVVAIGTKFISLASIMSAFLYPLLIRAFANHGLNVAMAVLTTVFVVYMHRENIKRMWDGKENKTDLLGLFRKKGEKKDE